MTIFAYCLFYLLTLQNTIPLFNSQTALNLNQWYIVDDGVMGGLSAGQVNESKDKHILFHGYVSTENNGGFSSLRYSLNSKEFNKQNAFKLKIKGDGKAYQFRVRSNNSQYYSYAHTFQSSGKWEEIIIPFSTLKPVFRGRQLDLEDYNGSPLVEIGFLIANKKNENFALEIAKVELITP